MSRDPNVIITHTRDGRLDGVDEEELHAWRAVMSRHQAASDLPDYYGHALARINDELNQRAQDKRHKEAMEVQRKLHENQISELQKLDSASSDQGTQHHRETQHLARKAYYAALAAVVVAIVAFLYDVLKPSTEAHAPLTRSSSTNAAAAVVENTGRHITPEQKQVILEALKDAPKGTVELDCSIGDPETKNFLAEIVGILREAGYSLRAKVDNSVSPPYPGLTYFTSASPPPPVVAAITSAFAKAEINKPSFLLVNTNSSVFRIWVGPKP